MEHLTLSRVNLHEQLTLLWPQDLALPRLRTVTLQPRYGRISDMPYSEGCLESLRSLLRVHSEQLGCVRIMSYVDLLDHLADALPSDLRRLEFEQYMAPRDAAALRRTHGLKELKLDIWSGEDARHEQTCIEITPAAIPTLEVLVVRPSLYEKPCNRSPCECENYDGHGTACARVPRLITELQGLVRRAPAPLHVMYGYSTMFFRHPVSETAGCPLCREASVEAAAVLHDYDMLPHNKLDGSVQCVKV
ncbi:hypothetical protein FOCC_FOCC017338 [Frankliniella occidentalis]|nr:hypothetical protein FOCC_FOCC017338 [Frankliniella occidentalis]